MTVDPQSGAVALGALFTLSGVAVIFWRGFVAARGEIDRAIKLMDRIFA